MNTVQDLEKEILEQASLTQELAADLPLTLKMMTGAQHVYERGKPTPNGSHVTLFIFRATPGEEEPWVPGDYRIYAAPAIQEEEFARYTVNRVSVGFDREMLSQDLFTIEVAGELRELALEQGVLEACPHEIEGEECPGVNPADAEKCGECGKTLQEEENAVPTAAGQAAAAPSLSPTSTPSTS